MPQRILFISNGHGEDNHSSHIIRTLRRLNPSLEIGAMPIVGEGAAYSRLGVPIIGPTKILPSGGFTYVNRLLLLRDIQAGLVGLLLQQLRAVLRYAPDCDLVHATGDGIGQAFAYLSGRPYISFISCLSSLYEGKLRLDPFLWRMLSSPRCLAVFTRDPYTAEDLTRQGLPRVHFGGIPSLDYLTATGKDLQLRQVPMIALLPGSRLPEAAHNLRLQLRLVQQIGRVMAGAVDFRAALVPRLMRELPAIAAAEGWQQHQDVLSYYEPAPGERPLAQVRCYDDAFNDIITQTTLVIGMAGLAVDQAVAIGKPVIQIPGPGPQFTYAFAEAQTRLLGISAQTIGTEPATETTLRLAAQRVADTLRDQAYLAACVDNGRARLGPAGGSLRIAKHILFHLGVPIPDNDIQVHTEDNPITTA
ncbi:Putative Glycosyltransferases protein [Halomicronema hongdechloris C2206]|uniref:Glycosyltransferases protein n=1 Tax=Halomicronema hongdechloris C2206 TaxID=1641165 RepID=A0A1Z3HIJ1_9CYAN|nr:lipid-A-disaccharide synthase-related protein [Halomicronema hongdechloris]ASC70076.1 Putative Glycosyltransferases protein [Halomicronema hongdechloris C2206]